MARWKYGMHADLTGRAAVVTGATSGVGEALAYALAEAGAHTVLAVRDTRKGERVRADVRAAVPGAQIEVQELDLADLGSVARAADGIAQKLPGIDLLINNGAVAAIPRQVTKDGFERQIGVAHFGHFALTGRLLPLLLAADAARIVTVTSSVARRPELPLDDLQSEKEYTRYGAYTKAKIANLLFALGLDTRLQRAGSRAISVSAQPGWTRSNLGPGQYAGRLERIGIAVGNALMGHSPLQGSQPILMAATSDIHGGAYVTPRRQNGLKGRPVAVDKREIPAKVETIDGLWAESERLTGVSYAALSRAGAPPRGKPTTPGGISR